MAATPPTVIPPPVTPAAPAPGIFATIFDDVATGISEAAAFEGNAVKVLEGFFGVGSPTAASIANTQTVIQQLVAKTLAVIGGVEQALVYTETIGIQVMDAVNGVAGVANGTTFGEKLANAVAYVVKNGIPLALTVVEAVDPAVGPAVTLLMPAINEAETILSGLIAQYL